MPFDVLLEDERQAWRDVMKAVLRGRSKFRIAGEAQTGAVIVKRTPAGELAKDLLEALSLVAGGGVYLSPQIRGRLRLKALDELSPISSQMLRGVAGGRTRKQIGKVRERKRRSFLVNGASLLIAPA